MNHRPDEPPGESGGPEAPRWLRLAATLRAEPDPATLAHVRARLAARSSEPAWVRWLARPVALAVSAGLLVVSAVAGTALVTTANSVPTDDGSMLSVMLGDDGSYGLPVTTGDTDASASDSGEVQR